MARWESTGAGSHGGEAAPHIDMREVAALARRLAYSRWYGGECHWVPICAMRLVNDADAADTTARAALT